MSNLEAVRRYQQRHREKYLADRRAARDVTWLCLAHHVEAHRKAA